EAFAPWRRGCRLRPRLPIPLPEAHPPAPPPRRDTTAPAPSSAASSFWATYTGIVECRLTDSHQNRGDVIRTAGGPGGIDQPAAFRLKGSGRRLVAQNRFDFFGLNHTVKSIAREQQNAGPLQPDRVLID